MELDRVSPYALSAFLGGAGVLRFVTPGFYDALILVLRALRVATRA